MKIEEEAIVENDIYTLDTLRKNELEMTTVCVARHGPVDMPDKAALLVAQEKVPFCRNPTKLIAIQQSWIHNEAGLSCQRPLIDEGIQVVKLSSMDMAAL